MLRLYKEMWSSQIPPKLYFSHGNLFIKEKCVDNGSVWIVEFISHELQGYLIVE